MTQTRRPLSQADFPPAAARHPTAALLIGHCRLEHTCIARDCQTRTFVPHIGGSPRSNRNSRKTIYDIGCLTGNPLPFVTARALERQ